VGVVEKKRDKMFEVEEESLNRRHTSLFTSSLVTPSQREELDG